MSTDQNQNTEGSSGSIIGLLFRNWKIVLLVVGGLVFFFSRGDSDSSGEEVTYKETLDPTQGVIAEIEEVDSNLFKISNETVIAERDSSLIIATFMGGQVDTFTLAEMELVHASDPNHRVFSPMRSLLFGGVMGYMMGKSMRTPVNPGAYKSESAFRKSSGTTESLKKTARKTTRPVRGKSGFGKSGSSRSFGG